MDAATGQPSEYRAEGDARRRLVSVVVPVFGGPQLDELVDRIEAAFPEGADDLEIILVDDGSRDARVWEKIESLVRERRRVRAVQLTRNFGQQAATLCGLEEARGDVIVTLDDDLQHDPADIPLLLAESQHDIVIAQFDEKQHTLWRRAASRVKGKFDEIVIGKPRHLQLSSFRVISRTVADGVLAIRTPNPFLPALMFHVSSDVAGVRVRHAPRVAGRSNYTLRALLRMFSNLVINNSSILLRVAATTGIAFAAFSFAMTIWIVYRKLVHQIGVQGWASIMATILLTGGLLLVSLGVVGEYLIRIIHSSESRPTYFVRRRVG